MKKAMIFGVLLLALLLNACTSASPQTPAAPVLPSPTSALQPTQPVCRLSPDYQFPTEPAVPTTEPTAVPTNPPAPTLEPTAPATEPPPAPPALDGQALLNERCTVCHNLSRVEREDGSLAEWTSIVADMVRKGASLSTAEQQALAEYLAATYPDN